MPNYKDFAIGLARNAGSIIKTNFALGMAKEWKADGSPLTATDLAINKMVTDATKENFPEYGLISEEGSNYSGQEYVWVCDPIDGTIPFSHGVPACTFMLALTKNGRSILGVVYDPFLDRLYFAEKGSGAFLNGNKITVSKNETIQNTAIGLLTWKTAKFRLTKLLDVLIDKGIIDFRLPSIGYLDMLVAAGEFGAVIFSGSSPWDSAAPKVIVEEAGGKFTDLYGKEQDFTQEVNGHLASNGLLHQELLDMIARSFRQNNVEHRL